MSQVFVGKVARSVANWGLVICIARVGGAIELGTYMLALSVCAPVFSFFDGNLRAYLVTDTLGEASSGSYLLFRAISMITSVVLLLVLVLCGLVKLDVLFLLLVASSKAVDMVSEFVVGFAQRAENMRPLSVFAVIRGWGGGMAFCLMYIVTGSLMASSAVASAGVSLDTMVARQTFSGRVRFLRSSD